MLATISAQHRTHHPARTLACTHSDNYLAVTFDACVSHGFTPRFPLSLFYCEKKRQATEESEGRRSRPNVKSGKEIQFGVVGTRGRGNEGKRMKWGFGSPLATKRPCARLDFCSVPGQPALCNLVSWSLPPNSRLVALETNVQPVNLDSLQSGTHCISRLLPARPTPPISKSPFRTPLLPRASCWL